MILGLLLPPRQACEHEGGNSATRKYLLVDHTTLGRLALLKIASLTELDLIITDAGADPEVLAAWTAAGIEFEVAR